MKKTHHSYFSKLITTVYIVFVFTLPLKAQFYTGGQSPAKLKWNQINSEYFQLIFPEGFEIQANRLLNTLEYARIMSGKSLHNYPRKISVVLHNRTIVSNAEVGWAPRRMVFFTQQPQDTYAHDWLEQLALHEYRHVVQIDKMNQGITRILSFLFGEQVTAGVYGLFVPWWFIEGDAVVNETVLSKSGRGRQPFFEMELRSQLLEKGIYSYDKAVHGSFKNFTTSHYNLGYYLVGYGRTQYGSEMWNNALNNVAKKPFSFTPFSSGIKKETNLNKEGFYKKVLIDLDSIWQNQDTEVEKTNLVLITKSDSYVNYLNPVALSEKELVAMKEDFSDVGKIIQIDSNGKEQKLLIPGRYFRESLSAKNGLICWAEYDYDPRWDYQSYSKIYTYSPGTQEKRLITSKQKYFSPALNSQGTKIVVAESSVNYEHYLAIVELAGGLKERVYSTSTNDFLSYPNWSDDDKKLIAISLNKNGKSIVEFDVNSGDYKYLLPFSEIDLSKAIYWKDFVIYQAAYSGISNIYALHIHSGEIYQITSSTFGAHSPQIWNENLLYSDYSSNGNQIAISKLDTNFWKPISKIENSNYPLAEILSDQENNLLISDSIPKTEYEVKKYHKISHLFNPHSWGPFTFNADSYEFKPGLSVSSQNKLSTLILSLGYEFDLNNQEGTYYADASYLGWYPALNFKAKYGYRERLVHDNQRDSSFIMSYHETDMHAGAYIPLYFSSGNWYQRIQPQINFEYKQLDVLNPGVRLHRNNYKIMDYRFSFSNFMRSPAQNMYPQWGQQFSFIYQNTPFDKSGNYIAISSIFYFPGIMKHQGLRFYIAYQKKIEDAGFYNNQISFSRGYTGLNFDESFSVKIDYKLPLAYPDFNLGPLIYIKRISTAVFYDQTKGTGEDLSKFRSLGNDILLDIHVLRSFVPIEIGLRSVYLIDSKTPYFGFLGSIKL
ncbi:MAG: hypothetical protein V1783_11435 [Bacteroidota bacterium]|jgi:hypothetical protein